MELSSSYPKGVFTIDGSYSNFLEKRNEFLQGQLQKEKCFGKTYAVIAMLKDKDIAGSLAPLQPIIVKWFIADLDVPRGATADFIASFIHKNHHCFPSPNDAHQAAIAEAKPHDRIIIFGSFYTVAEVLGSYL